MAALTVSPMAVKSLMPGVPTLPTYAVPAWMLIPRGNQGSFGPPLVYLHLATMGW